MYSGIAFLWRLHASLGFGQILGGSIIKLPSFWKSLHLRNCVYVVLKCWPVSSSLGFGIDQMALIKGFSTIWAQIHVSMSKLLGQSDFIFKRWCGSVYFRHWDQIRQEVQQTFDPTSADFTLEQIVALGLDHHAERISDISGAASKELSIEQVRYPSSELSLSHLG